MAHRLMPHPGQDFLEPEEVIERLKDEFDDVIADREQGADDVGSMIAKFIELKAPQQFIDECLAGQDRSYWVSVADDPTSEDDISFIIQPGVGPLIGYRSKQHEDAARPLLERCAAALNYQIVLV
jgi:hypothetical protein